MKRKSKDNSIHFVQWEDDGSIEIDIFKIEEIVESVIRDHIVSVRYMK